MLMPRVPDNSRSLALYLAELRKPAYAPLTQEIEAQLSQQLHEGNTIALSRLVCGNVRFVVSIASNYAGQGVTTEDLIAAGNEGLIIAAQRFNGSRNFKFISYSLWWIRNRMLKAIAQQSRTMNIPEHIACVVLPGIQHIQSQRLQNDNHEYSADELAKRYRTNLQRILDITALSNRTWSLNKEGYGVSGDSQMVDTITYNDSGDKDGAYPDYESTDSAAIVASEVTLVRMLLVQCTKREAEIIRMYFGVDGESPHTLSQIGRKLGVTRERTRQIVTKRLRSLREWYRKQK
jgi:RNA polymerase primary sigma factor